MSTCTRVHVLREANLAGLVCLCLSSLALAQTDGTPERDDEDSGSDTIDEIVVTAQKPGDRRQVEIPYEELVRERLLEELEIMRREQEESDWRSGPRVEDTSRMSFGYRPQDRYREGVDDSLTRLPVEYTRPATIFRFEF